MPVAASPRKFVNLFVAGIRLGDSLLYCITHTGGPNTSIQKAVELAADHRSPPYSGYIYRVCKGCRYSLPGDPLLSESSQRRQSTHKKAIQSSFNLSRQGESSIYVKIPSGRCLRGPESRTHSWIEKKQNCQVFPALGTSSFIPAVLARS